MTDWNETQESQEAVEPRESTDNDLSQVGQSSMRGDIGGQPDKPQDDEHLVTLHPGGSLEKEPVVETEPITAQVDPEDQFEDSEGSESSEGRPGSLEGNYGRGPEGLR